MRAAFDVLAGSRPGWRAVRQPDPAGRGLGSSSAAIVAGVRLARALVADGAARLDDAAALRLAAEIEGHPDNVAPCLLGGFTVAWSEDRRAGRCAGRSPRWARPAVSSCRARPRSCPARRPGGAAGDRAARGRGLQRGPGGTAGARDDRPTRRSCSRRPRIVCTRSYRAGDMPESARLLAELREAGVAAVISGAGPSVLALTSPPDGFEPGMEWTARRLAIDVTGARVDGGRLGHAERDPVAAGRKS